MVSKRELLSTIEKLEDMPPTYQNCEKLATFYTLYDHLYGEVSQPAPLPTQETIIGKHGDTDFLKSIEGKDAQQVWEIIDELVQTIALLDKRLYDGVMRRVEG